MSDGAVVARTPRLALVALTPAGLALVRAGVRALLPDDVAWAPDYPTGGDVLLAGLALGPGPLATADAPWGLLQVRLTEDSDDAAAVGGIGFKSSPAGGEAEIGYGLAPSVHGRGLATEAVGAMLAVARRHDLRRVTAQTAIGNDASRRVLEKNGFEVVAVEADMVRWQRDL